jgi:hypothetical protein
VSHEVVEGDDVVRLVDGVVVLRRFGSKLFVVSFEEMAMSRQKIFWRFRRHCSVGQRPSADLSSVENFSQLAFVLNKNQNNLKINDFAKIRFNQKDLIFSD